MAEIRVRSKPIWGWAFCYLVDEPPEWWNEAIRAGKVTKTPFAVTLDADGARVPLRRGMWVMKAVGGSLMAATDENFWKVFEVMGDGA